MHGQLSLTNDKGFLACGMEGEYVLDVTQASKGEYVRFKIDWGDGSVPQETGKFIQLSHTYTAYGSYTLKFYGKTAGVENWGTPVEYIVNTENKKITFGTDGSSVGTVCKGVVMELVLTKLETNSASTVYTVDYGDGSPTETYSGRMDKLPLRHTYTKSSCEEAGNEGGYTVMVSALNGCATKFEQTIGPYTVADILKLEMDLPAKRCTDYEVNLDAITTVKPAACGDLVIKKIWTLNGVPVENSYLTFENPGPYTIVATATMDGLDCGNDRIQKTIEIIEKVEAIVDPLLADVCENESVTLDASASKGGEKKYVWSVFKGDAAKVKFIPDATSEKVDAQFSSYGDYTIQVHVENDCSEDDAFVDIHVKKEPEVGKKKEIDPLCPEVNGNSGILTFDRHIVGYNWYNNPKNPTWTVTGPEGGWSWVGSDRHAEYPRIKFTKPGTYVLTVKVDGVDCGATADRLQKTWTVTVYDPSLTADIEVKGNKTEVCENKEVVEFVNRSSAIQPIGYQWTVNKEGRTAVEGVDYVFVTGNETSESPSLRFLTYGDYVVLVDLEVNCRWTERQFTFHVKKEPVATKTGGEIEAMCPEGEGNSGILDMSGRVSYTWYNDLAQSVEWSVTPATGFSWVTGYDRNSLFPQFRFTRQGNYVVKLKLAGAGCSDTPQELFWDVGVYDPEIRGDITLPADMQDICEGEVLVFNNTIEAVEPAYRWTVTRVEGDRAGDFTITPGINDKQPSITLHRYGTYRIHVDLTARCSSMQRDYTVLVRKDPEIVSFEELGNECKPAIVNLRGRIAYEWYNDTQKKLTWTVDKASGWSFINKEDRQKEYPVFKFTEPGTYRLTVTLDGVGCKGSKLVETREVTVLDPAIDKKITIEGETGNNTTVCESAEVAFRNVTESKIPIDYRWEVTANKVIREGVDYEYTRGDATSPDPKIKFNTYGEYTLEVSLTTTCNADNPTTDRFMVTVQRDPEVFLAALESICPGEVLDMNEEKVTYLWNDNRKKEVFWTVTTQDGRDAEGVTYDPAALYPRIVFAYPGTYKICVDLEYPVGCAGSALYAEKTVVVHDPAMELNVSPVTKELCEGNSYAFTNHSTATEPEKYKWSVEPAAGVPVDSWEWAPGAKDTDKAPAIQFNRYGIYTVKVVMSANNDCDTKQQEMTVTVKKDPSVQLGDYPDRCPGEWPLATADNYTWRDNPQEVTWTITPPDGIMMPPPTGLTPVVRFVHPGRYEVTATLTTHGCPGENLTDTRSFTVYPPDIQIHIDVPDQVEEGKSIVIGNHCVGQINGYTWSVGQTGGWEFVAPTGANDPEPEIKFTEYGNYRLKVEIDGECSDSVKYYDVAVKGIPEFKFAKFGNICAGTTLDMKEFLSCESKGATITPRWTITPQGNGEYEYLNAGGNTALYPVIHFIKKGTYTITLDADAEFGGHQQIVNRIHVLQNTVTASVRENLRACTKPSAPLEVELTDLSDGDSLHYEWSIQPATGWAYKTGGSHDRQPTISITDRGDYVIALNINNICGEDRAEFSVHAFTNPVISPIEDIRDVCDREYVFRGDELVQVGTNGDDLESVQWLISPEGYRFGEGEDASDLQPDITFKGKEEPYRLKLEVMNGCGDVVSEEFTVSVDEFRDITDMHDAELCALIPPVQLEAQPQGGVWTTDPADMIEKREDGEYYFDPRADIDQVYEVVYTYRHKSCIDRDTLQLTVHKLPVVNAGEDLERCLNLPALELQPGTPAGGEWKTNGIPVTHFDPSANGVGDFKLEYWYTDPSTHCPNHDSVVMTVHPLPDPRFTTPSQHCLGVDSLFTPVELGVRNRFEWNFDDGNKEMSEDKSVVHRYDQPGNYEVVLTATSVHGCVDVSPAVPLEVVNQPLDADFTVDKVEGCGPLEVRFTVDEEKYTGHPHGHMSYYWVFGNGEFSDRLQPDPVERTFLPPVYDTVYQVMFRVSNRCNTKIATRDIKVLSSPVARFEMMPEEGCDPLEVHFANLSTGNKNEYAWTFGDGATSTDREPIHTFRTGKKSTPYYIEMVAHNDCATTRFRDTITVKPNSLNVMFKMSDKYICAGETVCFTNFSSDTSSTILNQFWDFGDGQYSSAWDTCHRFERPGRLEVSVLLDNGCSKAGYSDTVVVYPIPQLTIESENQLCEGDTFHFALESDQALKKIDWTFGDGGIAAARSVMHAYGRPGFFTTEVKVISAEIASCPAQASKRVEAWPKSDVRILPLDTTVCPPFLYRPEIVGTGTNYFKWDYGDGSQLTSDMEHAYDNDSDDIRDYDIRAYVETDHGCKREYQGRIRVYNSPVAAWDKEISYGRPEKVRFINLSRNYTQCFWYLPDGSVVNSPEDQELVFEEEANYPLSLAVVNEYGCRDSLYLDYRSYQGGLYFPNTFIPHSTNAKVNRFNGIGMGLKEYHLEIFDLYGNKVWETSELSLGAPAAGWDGTDKKGKPLPQGVYMWRAKAIFFSEDVWTGKNNRSGNPQTTQGTVLLLRE